MSPLRVPISTTLRSTNFLASAECNAWDDRSGEMSHGTGTSCSQLIDFAYMYWTRPNARRDKVNLCAMQRVLYGAGATRARRWRLFPREGEPTRQLVPDKTGMANAEPITKYGITMRVLRPRSAYLPEIAHSPLYTVSLVLCCHSHFIEVLIIPFGRDP